MKSGQRGFTVVETLLVLILLAIIGFTGYYVWHTQKNTNSTYNNSAKLNSPANSTSSKTSTSNKIDTAAAEKLVNDFYTQYYQANGGSNVDSAPNPDQMKSLVQQYGTANLVNTYNSAKQFDPIACGQQVDPVTAVSSQPGDAKVIVSVQESFQDSTPLNFTVDVVNSSGLKIDAVNCPQP